MPAARQTISSCCGLTIGEATTTSDVSANHGSASQGEVRKVWRMDMGRVYGIDKTQVKCRPFAGTWRIRRDFAISITLAICFLS